MRTTKKQLAKAADFAPHRTMIRGFASFYRPNPNGSRNTYEFYLIEEDPLGYSPARQAIIRRVNWDDPVKLTSLGSPVSDFYGLITAWARSDLEMSHA